MTKDEIIADASNLVITLSTELDYIIAKRYELRQWLVVAARRCDAAFAERLQEIIAADEKDEADCQARLTAGIKSLDDSEANQ